MDTILENNCCIIGGCHYSKSQQLVVLKSQETVLENYIFDSTLTDFQKVPNYDFQISSESYWFFSYLQFDTDFKFWQPIWKSVKVELKK